MELTTTSSNPSLCEADYLLSVKNSEKIFKS
nr:MAG TPA: hypothetical protein [Siphoviridae sp. ctRJB2]DAJ52020.1 MAG TPA: hypothetical protein [Caudoviricetes sp.]